MLYFVIKLDQERLFGWHISLFPINSIGKSKITIGDWRTDMNGPMQVVSGAMNNEKVHFQAPNAHVLESEMNLFLSWFNDKSQIDSVVKAAVAHLWFVTIHPFDDGNGRIARALTDLLLARSDKSHQRFYSMSAQISIERKQYYDILEKTQKGTLDITDWIIWFLKCLIKALNSTETIFDKVVNKANYWNNKANVELNERQRKMINSLLDGFVGKLTSAKWATITKCSKETAIRDINDLISKNVLKKEEAGGRSTNYELR